MHSAPGEYHGFFWFYFINEQLYVFSTCAIRTITTPFRASGFGCFIWYGSFPGACIFRRRRDLSYRPVDRAGRMRVLALCWTGFVLLFFTFSTTQEYYSMPCYPALALLIGCAMAKGGSWVDWGTRAMGAVAACAGITVFALWFLVRNLPAPGDISGALSHNPGAYTLSLGHMQDLTIDSFAYLRAPLLVAGIAFAIGAVGVFLWRDWRIPLAAAAMMVVFFHAARMALVTFDPFLSSRPLADALLKQPPGTLVIDHHYYTFSSVFFYTGGGRGCSTAGSTTWYTALTRRALPISSWTTVNGSGCGSRPSDVIWWPMTTNCLDSAR